MKYIASEVLKSRNMNPVGWELGDLQTLDENEVQS
jgi:hypothetical protein